MGLHDPFGHLKHKLRPKEGSGVKLAIWLPTTKSQESPWFPCVQVACDIPLERSQRGLQLCIGSYLNQRFSHKVMGPQSCKSSNFGNFGTPIWKVSGQNDIWVLIPWPSIKYTIRGKVLASPKSRSWWILWIQVCSWLVLAPKVFQLCTNQLVWFV
jgi:hypothetical protein